jgi:glycosyltransferase involved in cell wall biosynthesis
LKESNDSRVLEIGNSSLKKLVGKIIWKIEKRLGLQSYLYPFAFALPFKSYFRRADVVHFHLIDDGFFSMWSLPLLSHLRPTVWTLHNPWAMTGHCVHPFDCQRWLTGCGSCPNLTTDFPLDRDTTAFLWRGKRWIYQHSNITLVVASNWMKKRVEESPLLSHFPCYLIPHGLDLKVFRPQEKAKSRLRLGIPVQAKVLSFRVRHDIEYKGLPWLLESLRLLQPSEPIFLLTLEEQGMLKDLQGKYQVIDMGWIWDSAKMADVLNAADLFLMPSIAESFGFMAVEAMACGTPVVGFDGTALPEVVKPPRGGLMVPLKNSAALARAIAMLLENDALRIRMGQEGRRIVEGEYSLGLQVQRLMALYKSLLDRWWKGKKGIIPRSLQVNGNGSEESV